MLKTLFKKKNPGRDLFLEFYEHEKDFFEGYDKPAAKLIYKIRKLLEAEQEELNSPDDSKIPSPSWMFYYWVGDCFVALDQYHSHPFQPKDESYSGDIKRAAKKLAKTPQVFAKIKNYLQKRGSKKAGKIVAELDKLQNLLELKITQVRQ